MTEEKMRALLKEIIDLPWAPDGWSYKGHANRPYWEYYIEQICDVLGEDYNEARERADENHFSK